MVRREERLSPSPSHGATSGAGTICDLRTPIFDYDRENKQEDAANGVLEPRHTCRGERRRHVTVPPNLARQSSCLTQ